MFKKFLDDEDGTEVIEYALIIALVSIGLIVALQPLSVSTGFGSFIGRFTTCMTSTSCK